MIHWRAILSSVCCPRTLKQHVDRGGKESNSRPSSKQITLFPAPRLRQRFSKHMSVSDKFHTFKFTLKMGILHSSPVLTVYSDCWLATSFSFLFSLSLQGKYKCYYLCAISWHLMVWQLPWFCCGPLWQLLSHAMPNEIYFCYGLVLFSWVGFFFVFMSGLQKKKKELSSQFPSFAVKILSFHLMGWMCM